MPKQIGLQGDSLTVDANGELSADELKAMYAHWIKKSDDEGDNPSGVRPVVFPHDAVTPVPQSSST